MLSIGQNIRTYREAARMTQAELSAATGINRITIHKYEAGKLNPRAKNLQKIADAIGTAPGNLMGETAEREEILLACPHAREICELLVMMSEKDRDLAARLIWVLAERSTDAKS